MACTASAIPAFPGGRFTLAYPEAIGDAANPAGISTHQADLGSEG